MFAIGDVEALLRDTGHAGWLTTCFARARGCTAVAPRLYAPRDGNWRSIWSPRRARFPPYG
jgi:hypothetical protein